MPTASPCRESTPTSQMEVPVSSDRHHESGKPWIVGAANTPGDAYGVAVSGNYAYVADRALGLQVIDITNPAKPLDRGRRVHAGLCPRRRPVGNYAYVADGGFGLMIARSSATRLCLPSA